MYKHSCYIVIKRGSGAVGKFPAPFIVSLFMGIGRDTKPFSRRLGRGILPMSSCLLGFNRSALGVKKMWSGYLMCDCLHPEVVRLVDPAKSIWGFGTSGTVASAPGQFIETLDIAISLAHAISHGSNFEDYLWDSEIHRGCFQA